MKRCPQCLFLYPDSDETCDFDKTPLVTVNEAEIEAATNPVKTSRRRGKALPIAAAALLLGVFVFAIYYAVSQVRKTSVAIQESNILAPVVPSPTVVPLRSPAPVVSPSPTPAPAASPSPKPPSTTVSTSHSRATTDPVSTSGPGMGTRQGAKPVIMLTSGGKIEADEVWRTKDGVWYRRNGIVTLLKRSQVKAIATR
jgi:hypothetical protein